MRLMNEYKVQLERVYREVVALDLYGELRELQAPAIDCVREALRVIESIVEECGTSTRYQASVVVEPVVGLDLTFPDTS